MTHTKTHKKAQNKSVKGKKGGMATMVGATVGALTGAALGGIAGAALSDEKTRKKIEETMDTVAERAPDALQSLNNTAQAVTSQQGKKQ